MNAIANQKPQDGPFALPLKKFPASVSTTQQARIKEEVLAAISGQVDPAYVRFGKFLKAQYIPGGRNDPGLWALPDGDAYYRFLVKRSTTTDLMPDQIHQCNLTSAQRGGVIEEQNPNGRRNFVDVVSGFHQLLIWMAERAGSMLPYLRTSTRTRQAIVTVIS